jgi:hypothetical protein
MAQRIAGIGAFGGLYTRTLTLGIADLTAAALTQAFNLGVVTPPGANSIVVGVSNSGVAVDFTDGAAGTFAVEIGNFADPNSVGTLDVDGLVGANFPLALGIAPFAVFGAGAQIQATMVGSVNVNTATAGNVTITLLMAQLQLLA